MKRSYLPFLLLLFTCALLVASTVASAGRDASASADVVPRAYWVFFRDHGLATDETPGDLRLPAVISPRAVARRARAARERGAVPVRSDDLDLEPPSKYIAALERVGATIRLRSRWFNGVSVEADPVVIEVLRRFSFVSEVVPVVSVARDEAAATSAANRRDAADGRDAADASEYGEAFRQVEMLDIPAAHALGYRGQGVLICVLDSGFDLSHEALRHLVVREERDFLGHDRDVSFDPRQDLPRQAYHGTQVLSALAGNAPGELVGPAPDAEFLLGKTEDIGREIQIEEDAWVAAVEWAEQQGADILVSSLTYSTWYKPQQRDGRTAIITRAANLAFERGLLIVNSMGNYGPKERTLSPPADAPGVIAVGSVDSNGEISAFSSLGPTWDGRVKPDLVAMGSGTRVVAGGTRDEYTAGTGTSFSNPLVAGCAAIVLSAHPDWGPEAVREALLMSANRASRPDPKYGWGIPSALDAVHYPAIEGVVRDMHTKEPIANAKVSWEPRGKRNSAGAGSSAGAGGGTAASAPTDSSAAAPSDSPPRGAVTTDPAGEYLIPNLPNGTYTLRVDAPGYFESISEPLEVPPGLGDVNFTLRYRGE